MSCLLSSRADSELRRDSGGGTGPCEATDSWAGTMSRLWLIIICAALLPGVLPASRYVPKWKKQACEIPARENQNSHYVCTDNGDVKCLPGWTGDLCDVPLCRKGCDPLQGYCKRPGECRCKLGFYGELCNKCIGLIGCQYGSCNASFDCNCLPGWDGMFCSDPICHNDCHKTRGYCQWPGECRCRLGWAGRTCEDCQVLPGCQHGYCNRPLECRCHEGFTGILCQTPICAENCNRERGYCRKPDECRCRVGWWGKNCDTCFPYPGCKHGSCNRPWECNCEPGWGGALCDQELTHCRDHPDACENGATCVSLSEEDGGYRCLCAEGYTGRSCEVEKYTTSSTTPAPLDANATLQEP
ncbi:neurogenic locus protein delta-like isoform X2 [Bacillus rossius redtenbacheri]|uniref:neurogenic locus protein delta-like isoform X2 n=1 Tax=Bacillus rossius redtenbacheri TaxID=93214 RepID=UPI002FDD52A6